MFSLVATSHSLIVLSCEPEASIVPSGENATRTERVCFSRVAIFSLVAISHSLTVPSCAPEARILLSGENATERTQCVCLSVAMFSLVATSHSLIVLSGEPEASVVPLGENVTERTERVCPSSVTIRCGDNSRRLNASASHALTFPSVSTAIIKIGCTGDSERLENTADGITPS